MDVKIQAVKDALCQKQGSGVPLTASDTVSNTYALVSSLHDVDWEPSTSEDWAMVSYVHTNSALGMGGMPEWVAADVDQVLDGLLEASIVAQRAIWFDKVGMHLHDDWPAMATLQCLAVPVICVPPTRTIEYSRYQVPDRWDSASFDLFTQLENLLRLCSTCGSKCPLEFDSRLLNIAAALRAWPIMEAVMASSARGAFISFATLDRLQYTISWYQVLLYISLDLGGYGPDLLRKSVELYGPALFEPCARCMSVARELIYEEQSNVKCQLLDDALSTLLMQANRFSLPKATNREGKTLWTLDGLHRSPGEGALWHGNNGQRLKTLQRTSLSQSAFREVAANFCRGRPSLSSCFEDGDKWLTSLIISNIRSFQRKIELLPGSFSEVIRESTFHHLTTGEPFGDLRFEDNSLETDATRCIRSPPCSGRSGSTCLFNHLSGVLPPASVGQLLTGRQFSISDCTKIIESRQEAFRRSVLPRCVALMAFEFIDGAVKDHGSGCCGACFKPSVRGDIVHKRLILIGWKTQENKRSAESTPYEDWAYDDTVYSFITVDAGQSNHVRSRGIFSRETSARCGNCAAEYVRAEVEGSRDVLEIHVAKLLPPAGSLQIVFRALETSHES